MVAAICHPAQAQMPDAIAASGEIVIASIHAQGAQVYECKADHAGKLVWQFREPVATLLLDGKTIGPRPSSASTPPEAWPKAPATRRARS